MQPKPVRETPFPEIQPKFPAREFHEGFGLVGFQNEGVEKVCPNLGLQSLKADKVVVGRHETRISTAEILHLIQQKLHEFEAIDGYFSIDLV